MQIINFYQKIEEPLRACAQRLVILYHYAKTQTFHIKKKDNIKFHIIGYLQKMFMNNYLID